MYIYSKRETEKQSARRERRGIEEEAERREVQRRRQKGERYRGGGREWRVREKK
jgi:hypothetical protein